MINFTPKTFNIPTLTGISNKNIEEHLKLYAGYTNNANSILQKLEELKTDKDKNAYLLGELFRRFSFEFNGMRNHEIYFSSFEGGPTSLADSSLLQKAIATNWGSFENWLTEFKSLALTRGIGWAALWFDQKSGNLLNSWIDEQHLGQLNECKMILGLDMWEHSYVADYQPSGKKKYVEDFFTNLNWQIVSDRFDASSK